MSIGGFLFGEDRKKRKTKKEFQDLRKIFQNIAEHHASVNYGKKRRSYGKERSVNSSNSNYRRFKQELRDFMKRREDLRNFTGAVNNIEGSVKTPADALNFYVQLLENEEIEVLDEINREIESFDPLVGDLLEEGLKELEIAKEDRIKKQKP